MLTVLILSSCQHIKSTSEISVVAQERAEPAHGKLELLTPDDSLVFEQIQLRFRVEDYQLGIRTPGERAKILANSQKGQHIHLIVDERPYMAKYDKEFALELEPGKHTILAFLSRSFHESIKNPEAFELREVVVGESGEALSSTISEPGIFFSRPKGKYVVDDVENTPILLDFYLANVDLGRGSRVKAIIDDNEFVLPEWKPYFIYGLDEGEHTISLELINTKGERIEGERTYSGKRKFEITKSSK